MSSLAIKPKPTRRFLPLLTLIASCASSSDSAGGPKPDWSVADMPPQTGRVVVITGGTSGIGYESAKALAAAGAQVIIAARNPDRGKEAIDSIKAEVPAANVQFEAFDLADLKSVTTFGERLGATLPRIDVLINNAAIMTPPQRGTSSDGFESQFAINYLGHFALTAAVLPLLQKSETPRVVTLSSIAANDAHINFTDLQYEKDWDAMEAYSQSKLACLIFALELQRRSDAAGWHLASIPSHPGVSRTNLLVNAEGFSGFVRRHLAFLFQPSDHGALPTLYAATAPDARGGTYYGPIDFGGTRGDLGRAKVPDAALNQETALHLWQVSEELTRTRYPAPAI